jgi:hypothetical protein
VRPDCPFCGLHPQFAAGYHQGHRYVNSHRCSQNNDQVFAACECGASAWCADTDEALERMGGSREPAVAS